MNYRFIRNQGKCIRAIGGNFCASYALNSFILSADTKRVIWFSCLRIIRCCQFLYMKMQYSSIFFCDVLSIIFGIVTVGKDPSFVEYLLIIFRNTTLFRKINEYIFIIIPGI